MSWNQASSNWGAQQGAQQSWGASQPASGGGAWGGQQAAAGGNNWGQAAANPSQLSVQGCQHPTIGSIVRGSFSVHSENHAKPVYKKDSQVSGLDVMIYYWDERDGASQAGWWFGPKVGGEQVWAYSPDLTTKSPPRTGWQVPYGGPVDASFIVESGAAAPAATPSWQQAAPQMTPPPQQSWQQPAAQPAAQAWAQPAAQPQAQSWNQPAAKPAANNWQQPAAQPAQQSWGAQAAKPAWGQQAAAAAAPQQQTWQMQQQNQAAQKQAQMAEMKRKQEENKAKLEMARAAQMEEQKKKMAEMQRLREAAVLKKTEEQEKMKADMLVKMKAEEQRRLESKATFAIRRIIQKVRVATPENIEALETELNTEMEKEMPNCGTQGEKLKEEAERGLEQAKKRIEQINAERAKELEKKAEIEKLKKEKQDKAQALCEQLEALVETAETQATNLKEATKKLDFAEGATSSKAVESEFEKISKGSEDCKAASKACMDLVKEESATMKDPHALVETKQACAKLLNRIQESQKGVDATMAEAKGAKAKALKKAVAQEKTKAIEKTFKKYDKDSDKALSQKEVTAYAKGEFGVQLQKETIDWIWKCCVAENAKGVQIEKLHQLTSIVGVHRELARDKQRTADRVEKEKVIGGMKDAVKAKAAAAEKFIANAEKAVEAAEKEVAAFNKAKVTPSEEMIAQTEKSLKKVKEVTALYEKAKKEMAKCGEGLAAKYEKDLKAFLATQAKLSEIKMGRLEMRIERVSTISRRYKDQATWKGVDALEQLRTKALKIMHFAQVKNDLSDEELFDMFAAGKGKVDKKAFVAFFATADNVVRPIKEKQDEAEAKEEEEKVEEETKAAEEPAAEAEEEKKDEEMKEAEEPKEEEEEEEEKKEGEEEEKTEEQKKTEEAQKKKETMAAAVAAKKREMEEKKKEAAAKVLEAKKKAEEAKKEAEEEARIKKEEAEKETVEISAGELAMLFAYLDEDKKGALAKERFLQINTRYMKVVKETAMTSAMGVAGGKLLRKLEANEIVHVTKGPIKGSNEVSRVFCKAIKDDLEGWVSMAGNAGTKFLQDGGAVYKVVKRSVMTDSFEINGEATDDAQKLRPGTVLEVREFPKKDEESGLTRMKGKVRGPGGATGWVTTISKDNKVFAKA